MENLYIQDQIIRVVYKRGSCDEMMTVIDSVANDETGKLRKILKEKLLERLERLSKDKLTGSCEELMDNEKDYCSMLLRATRKKKPADAIPVQQ
jgi:hypothetical protein